MSAPSFSSFPPIFDSFPELEPGPSRLPDKSKPSDYEHKSKKRRSKEDKAKRDRQKTDNPSGRDKVHSVSEGRTHKKRRKQDAPRDYAVFEDELLKAQEDSRRRTEEEQSQATSPPLFFTDRKGDILNVTYGTPHAGDVPRYRLVGGGRRILGLDGPWVAVYRSRGGVEIGMSNRRKLPGLTDPGSRHMLSAPTRSLITPAKDTHKYEEIDGFLRLSSGRASTSQPYRSISQPNPDANSDTGSSSDEDSATGSDLDSDSDTTPLTALQQTLTSLETQLATTPTSVSTWLSLLSHTLSTVPSTSKNAPAARAEISLAVLKRALAAHPDNARNPRLRLRYLRAGEEVWHSSVLRSEWEDALRTSDPDLWMAWLDWRVGSAERGVEGVVEDARRALDSFNMQETRGNEARETALLRVFWRVAVAFRDAGFVERAMAMFQAQAELSYKLPSALAAATFVAQLDALEEFWESEVPRLGEPGALGWTSWHATSTVSSTPNALDGNGPADLESESGDPFMRWAVAELHADRTKLLAKRTTDTEAEDDPYATILFSDLRQLLVPLHTRVGRHAFRLIWLSVLGLHIPGLAAYLTSHSEGHDGDYGDANEGSADDRWALGHLASPAYLAVIFADADGGARRVTADAQAGVLVGREREYASGFGPVKSWGYGAVRPLERWAIWGPEDVQYINMGLVRNVFSGCRGATGQEEDEEWDVLTVTFEAAVSIKGALRVSKTLLAGARDSLPRWAAHARVERLRGRLEDARKVYTMVARPGTGMLWWDWAEMEWLAGDVDVALRIILRATAVDGTGGIAILRAKRRLAEIVAEVDLGSRWVEYGAWVRLWALLELLTASVDAALSVLDTQLSVLRVGTVVHESLTVAALWMIYAHGVLLKNVVPPGVLRERAGRAVTAYAGNTVVLGMFLEAERGQGVWGRVRGIMGEGTADGAPVVKGVERRVAEVWVAGWERGRWAWEVERTRSGLSAAVQDERTRGSAILWRIYVEFEIRAGELQRAKKLLFRAVGECTLAKELYLLAFGPLRRVFSARELGEWGERMAEQGVRMRRGLDEALAGWQEHAPDDEADNRDEADDEDEIEHNAKELRRLRPY